LVQGYEDLNDHEQLRYDPERVGARQNSNGTQQVFLAGKSTLNRIEHCPETVTNRADSRYHRGGHDGKAIEKKFVEFFLESYPKPPRQIVNLDVTDDR